LYIIKIGLQDYTDIDIDKYVCDNATYVKGQYNFWNKEEYQIFEKPVNMHWQKYDIDFLEEFYGEKKGEDYYKIIEKIKAFYKSNKQEFEGNKYFVFTDLCYISNRKQDDVEKDLDNKIYNQINNLFYKQLEYYKSNITVVANSKASNIVLEKIIKTGKENWKRVVLEGDIGYEKYSNIYKLNGKESYVYLTARYFDRQAISLRRNFAKEIKKLMDGKIAKIEDI